MQQRSLHFCTFPFDSSLCVKQIKHPGVRGSHLQLTSRTAQIIWCSVCTCFSVPLWLNQIYYGKCAFTLYAFYFFSAHVSFYFTVSESTSHLLCVMRIWLTSRECWISKTWNMPTYGEPYTCQWFGVEYCSYVTPAVTLTYSHNFRQASVLRMHFRNLMFFKTQLDWFLCHRHEGGGRVDKRMNKVKIEKIPDSMFF